MAEGLRFVCATCSHAIEAWSDGNPYYIDENGDKKYAYHPDHENLARCIGNDSPHLCLSCGEPHKVDSRSPIAACPSCAAETLQPKFRLEGCRCPYCREGSFEVDRGFHAIS